MADERLHADEPAASEEPAAEAGAKAGGFGARLAAARTARGLDQADLARALNLRVEVISALEAEDRDQLPRLAFVRGYLRSYGRLMDFPEAEIHEALEAWRNPAEEDRLIVSPGSVVKSRGFARTLHGHAGLVMTVLSLVTAALVVVFLVAIWPEGGLEATVQTQPSARPAEQPAARVPLNPTQPRIVPPAASETSTEAEEAMAAAEVRTSAEATVTSEDSAIAQAPATAAENRATAPATPAARTAETRAEIQRERAEDGRLVRVLASGEDRLLVRFSDDCWVEVRDMDGRDLHGDLHRAGQQLELTGTGPFRLLLGYAHGVEVAYNGETVDVAPHIRNDVASLVVGR